MMIGPIQLLMGFYGRFAAGLRLWHLFVIIMCHNMKASLWLDGMTAILWCHPRQLRKCVKWFSGFIMINKPAIKWQKASPLLPCVGYGQTYHFQFKLNSCFFNFRKISFKISTQLVFLLLAHSYPTDIPLCFHVYSNFSKLQCDDVRKKWKVF